MTEVLLLIVAKQQIRRVRTPGNPTVYYLPSEAELEAERRQAGKQSEVKPEWSGIVRSGRVTSY
jgi:hypothetical protein